MSKITKSSTAEYFAKNLQQVGFSSPLKAVLTTLKEAVDNSLDACEHAGILPELTVEITRKGVGSTKNTELIHIAVEDNGPGIEPDDLAKVFGEYLASSKFGKGQCSRGQQGIGISAATTWAQLTNAKGAFVTTKRAAMRKAVTAQVDVDIKSNTGVVRKRDTIDWEETIAGKKMGPKKSGVRCEFSLDGRIQLNGDGGLITYLEGTVLVNPHLTLHYKLLDNDWVTVERVSNEVPEVPEATLPHPHTFKLGEFITHSHLFGKVSMEKFLRTGFSRVSDDAIKKLKEKGVGKALLDRPLTGMKDEDFKKVFTTIQEVELMAPSTKSVLNIGEDALSKSIARLGEIDFFSVVTRKPAICDFKPVAIEVALARFKNRNLEADAPVQLLRFANRVPLQFDKSGCAITWAIESVNWKTYGLAQPKESLPLGPYVFAVSVVSPFIKFKNASKETVDASEELVEEIRRALIQAGQKLSRHIRKEAKEADLERKLAHIEQFGPILVESLVNITKSSAARKKKAEEGLMKLLGRDSSEAHAELEEASAKLKDLHAREAKKRGEDPGAGPAGATVADEAPNKEEGPAQAEMFEEAKDAVVAQAKKAGKAASKKQASKSK